MPQQIDQKTLTAALGALVPKEPTERPRLRLTGSSSSNEAAASRLRQLESLLIEVEDLLEQTKDPMRRERLEEKIERIEKARDDLRKSLGKDSGRLEELLTERPFKPPTRPLTLQEKRINFERLNEDFNRFQAGLEDKLHAATNDEIARVGGTVRRKIKAGDIAGLAALAFLLRGTAKDAITSSIKEAYLHGKTMAAKEMGIARPPTSNEATQLMNLDGSDLADTYASNLENSAKAAVRAGLGAGADAGAIVSHVQQTVSDDAEKAISGLSSTLSGQYLNRGRMDVFFANAEQIVSYVRSEILDDATCDACLSLDGRVVAPDDPFVNMDIVHSGCRGLWTPTYATDPVEDQPDIGGIPKSIADNFRTVGGRPVVNLFKQLKKPLPQSEAAIKQANSNAAAKAK